jgi:hypothetical protein
MRLRTLELDVLEDRTVPATFTVSTLADDGIGSLRQAIDQANAAQGADVVEFASGVEGVITLTSGQIEIRDSLTIDGPGADLLTVSGNDQSRVLSVIGAAEERLFVTIGGLTLANGNGDNTEVGLRAGGALLSLFSVSLTIQDSVIRDSVGNSGGGVAARGIDNDLVIERSQILNNESVGVLSDGGGVSVSGRSFQFIDSTADGNIASYSGGGLSIQTDTGVVFGSTISNNIASSGGGGGLQAGLINTTTITNSTIADNQANGGFSGGGILAFDVMAINNSTIVRNVENSEGGSAGIEAFLGSEVTLLSSLVAENAVPGNPVFWATDVGGDVTSLGNNLIGDTKGSEGSTWLDSDILDVDSNLPELADNGGLTKTILPNGASFANGNGANPLGLPFDQRGEGFPRGGDIGAVSGGNARVNRPSGSTASPTRGGSNVVGVVDDEVDHVSGYIRALYFTILGRDADAQGLAAYTKNLKNGETVEWVARSIWTSAEHRTMQVQEYYLKFLGRSGSADEIDSYVQSMLDGASEEDVVTSILASDEYRNRFPTTDLWITQLYIDVLGRTPGSAETANYVDLVNAGASPETVVRSIVTSVEARVLQVTALYQQLLRRTPGGVELQMYQDRLTSVELITELAVEIAASDEMITLSAAFAV